MPPFLLLFLVFFCFVLFYLSLVALQCCCCCSCLVTKSCPTLCDTMDCRTPGFPVLHHLPEFAQVHVHWVSDAIQSSHPLSSPFSSCPQYFPVSGSFPMSWLFVSSGQSFGGLASALVLPMNIQGSFTLGNHCFTMLLVSAVQQSKSDLCIHISSLSWISFPFRSPQSTK